MVGCKGKQKAQNNFRTHGNARQKEGREYQFGSHTNANNGQGGQENGLMRSNKACQQDTGNKANPMDLGCRGNIPNGVHNHFTERGNRRHVTQHARQNCRNEPQHDRPCFGYNASGKNVHKQGCCNDAGHAYRIRGPRLRKL